MSQKFTQRLTLGIACVALFAAAGGPSYAVNATTAALSKNSVTNSSIKSNAITSAKIKNGQVKSSDIGTGAVTAAKLAGNSVDATKLTVNSVDSTKVADNSLAGPDVSLKSGTLATYNAPNVGAQSCVQNVVDVAAGVDLRDAVIAVTMEDSWPSGVAVTVENSSTTGTIRLNLCNNSGAAVNPGVVPFHWIAFKP
jgi:hypothetical protein